MLINFSFSNWRSFSGDVNFSMLATKERQHQGRLAKLSEYKKSILPIAVIYGGNASGKSNFFNALHFVQKLVVRGTEVNDLIPIESFKLDQEKNDSPSYFAISMLINQKIYELSFLITPDKIIEEKLVYLKKDGTESIRYKRLIDEKGKKQLADEGLFQKKDAARKTKKDNTSPNKEILQFVFKGTRDNQLFLTNAVSQNVGEFIAEFQQIYNWFSRTLTLINPQTLFGSSQEFMLENSPLQADMNSMLKNLDTGINSLTGGKIPIDSVPNLPSFIPQKIKEGQVVVLNSELGDRFVIRRFQGELIAIKLFSEHLKSDGTLIKFDITDESDGTKRLIDLLPAFLSLTTKKGEESKVYIIDELDRSLHHIVTDNLLKFYLENCSKDTRNQLLFTTHDLLLMNQKLLRRDEIWVTERNSHGSSNFFSFSDYKNIRYDKNIQKSYLLGRLGGIPRISLGI